MSKYARAKGCNQSQTACRCGQPTKQQIDAITTRLIQENRHWSIWRCAQRARVVVYTGAVK